MEPVDKFGKPIYPKIYRQLLTIGSQLKRYGYAESDRRPNLFSISFMHVTFWVDLRGTEQVPIWQFPVGMFYWTVSPQFPDDGKRYGIRAALIEANRLHEVPLRASFPALHELSMSSDAVARRLAKLFREREEVLRERFPRAHRRFDEASIATNFLLPRFGRRWR